MALIPTRNTEEEKDHLLTDRMRAELERDKRRWTIRRRLTLAAFMFNCTIVVAILFMIFINRSIESLADFNGIVITVLGGNFGMIMAYYGLNTIETMQHDKLDKK